MPIEKFLRSIAVGLFHLGGLGLLLLGAVDSSFLSVPLGNDLLMIVVSASHHGRMLYYALMATAGSLLGCASVDVISRKAEAGLEKIEKNVPQQRLQFVELQVRKRAGWATAVAALVPPPFPFTPFVAAAAGVGYPRKKLLSIIGAARFVRFSVEGVLAIHYGRGILALADSRKVEYSVFGLIVLAMGLSGLSIYRWVRNARRPQALAPAEQHGPAGDPKTANRQGAKSH